MTILLRYAADYAFRIMVRQKLVTLGYVPEFIKSKKIAAEELKALQFVALSQFHCGPVAIKMADFLRKSGHPEFVVQNIEGHYIVKNKLNGLIFDIEAWKGVERYDQLPLATRFRLMETLACGTSESPYITKEVFRYSARKLLASWRT